MTDQVVAYFPIVFAVLWFAMSALLASWSGWAQLAKTHSAVNKIEGEHFRFVSGSIGRGVPVSYSSCLFVTVNELGFRLSVLFPFRFRSPPLFLSWSDVESVSEKRFLSTFR